MYVKIVDTLVVVRGDSMDSVLSSQEGLRREGLWRVGVQDDQDGSPTEDLDRGREKDGNGGDDVIRWH